MTDVVISRKRRGVLKGLAGAVAAPWVAPALAQSNKPINFAIVAAQSGPVGVADHADYINGARLAVKEINAAGGVRGREIKIQLYDIDLLTPEGTQAAFRKVVDAKPHAVGCAFTLITTPGFEVISNHKAPYLHGETKEEAVNLIKGDPKKYSHIFQVDPPEVYYGKMFPLFLEQLAATGAWKPINNKVHVVREQLGYNMVIAREVVDALKKSKFELAKITDIRAPVQDWGSVIQELKATGAGTIMIDHWMGAEEAAFCQQFVADPIPGALVYLQYGPSQPEFLNLAGSAAEGFVWSTVLGVYNDAQGAEFRKKYAAAYPGIIGLCYTGSAYDTLQMLKNAWTAAEPEDFAAACTYLRTHTYRGVDGAVDLNNEYQAALHYPMQTQDLNKGMAQLFFQVQDGQHKIIQPDALAEVKYRSVPWKA
jgi:branched-chain amino acid transport system substrate-binding protein